MANSENRDKIIINFGLVRLLLKGSSELTALAEEYFPNGICSTEEMEPDIEVAYCGYLEEKMEIPARAKPVRSFMGAPYRVWREGERFIALCTADYEYGGHVVIREGKHIKVFTMPEKSKYASGPVWAIRISREVYLRKALLEGYIPLHASAAVLDNKAIIFFGKKGKGKSTCLYSTVRSFGAYPMSNDLVLVGKKGETWVARGWPWKVTIGNSLLKAAGDLDDPNAKLHEKTEVTPLKFCNWFEVPWLWDAPLGCIVNPYVDPAAECVKTPLSAKELGELLLQEGQEEWEWGDVLQLGGQLPDFDSILSGIAKDIPGYKLEGNIWEGTRDGSIIR